MRSGTQALLVCVAWLGGCGGSGGGNAGGADAAEEGSVTGADASGGNDGDGGSEPEGDTGPGEADALSVYTPGEGGGGPPPDAASDAPAESSGSGDAGGAACGAASGCRKFSDYCGGCSCIALAVGDPAPTCDAGTVSCLVDPCASKTVACGPAGRCVLQ
jgi:hypothetical protein